MIIIIIIVIQLAMMKWLEMKNETTDENCNGLNSFCPGPAASC